MDWWGRVFGQRGYRISVDKSGSNFLYCEHGLRMHVAGEIVPDGYAVYSSTIIKWETKSGEAVADAPLVDEAERMRIAGNIRRYFVERGKVVYLS